ncbi:hypothetical protein ACXYMX_09675 [Sporosarcina sp. CAU 1771]
MGNVCPCGVTVNACSENNNVIFHGKRGTVKGNLTYLASVCITTLEAATLSLEFEDTKYYGKHSFLFTADAITSVVCKKEGENCLVTVKGTGKVNGVSYAFEAVFKDLNAMANFDNVLSFVISGFFDQNGAAPVPQGSISALGCQEL